MNNKESSIIHNYLSLEELKSKSIITSEKLFKDDFQLLKYAANLKFDPINVLKEDEDIKKSRKLYNFIKEESDNISQLMSLTIMLSKLNYKNIERLENQELSEIFNHQQERKILQNSMKNLKQLDPNSFLQEYLEACNKSKTRIIPCVKEFS